MFGPDRRCSGTDSVESTYFAIRAGILDVLKTLRRLDADGLVHMVVSQRAKGSAGT